MAVVISKKHYKIIRDSNTYLKSQLVGSWPAGYLQAKARLKRTLSPNGQRSKT